MNNEATEVTLAVTSILEEMGVVCAIGGPLASTMHGVARSTLDSDIVADLQTEQVPILVARLENDFYVSDTAIYEAIRYRSSFNLIHLSTMFKIDIFLPKDRNLDRAQLRRRRAQILTHDPEQKAYMITAEDSILAKLDWYRQGGESSERQWRDVQGIVDVQGENLDWPYLRQSAQDLGEATCWRNCSHPDKRYQTVRSPILCRHAASLCGGSSQPPKHNKAAHPCGCAALFNSIGCV